MREITTHRVNGCNEALKILAVDGPGPGGASHKYHVTTGNKPLRAELKHPSVCCDLEFQNGPMGEVGTNGITHEVLIAILIDRLEGFQRGPFACDQNADALYHLRAARAVLNDRTRKRVERGVEGTHVV